jgi:hypothetical protein
LHGLAHLWATRSQHLSVASLIRPIWSVDDDE